MPDSGSAAIATGGEVARPRTIELVCPLCHAPLDEGPDKLTCTAHVDAACPGEFPRRNGFADLVVGERFPDEDLEERNTYEEACNAYSTQHFWIPRFRELWPDAGTRPRLLAIGCGVGVEVELLNDAGFDCHGIDCGNRTGFWLRRRHRESLVMSNGMHLPFASGTFDGVFCGCVFAHVGVVGDSGTLKPEGLAERQKLASEMVRVTKPGGAIMVATPNRLFPFDLFHGRGAGSYKVRFNPPHHRYLLSASDLRRMFVDGAGCRSLELVSVEGFWGFIRANRSVRGWLLSLPVKSVFRLLARPWLKSLRGSVIAPWITASIRK